MFIKSKLNFSVCSCDFSLRGNDAKKDILHVKKICSDKKIKFFSKVFDTNKYSKSNKISIQMASRDLRYNWFKNLMRDNSIDYLVTAHHSDDNYETIIFNLLKTTGYKGLIGIPHFNNKIIRPLINVEKKDSQYINIPQAEPLMEECKHFIKLINKEVQNITDGIEGRKVLEILTKANEYNNNLGKL